MIPVSPKSHRNPLYRHANNGHAESKDNDMNHNAPSLYRDPRRKQHQPQVPPAIRGYSYQSPANVNTAFHRDPYHHRVSGGGSIQYLNLQASSSSSSSAATNTHNASYHDPYYRGGVGGNQYVDLQAASSSSPYFWHPGYDNTFSYPRRTEEKLPDNYRDGTASSIHRSPQKSHVKSKVTRETATYQVKLASKRPSAKKTTIVKATKKHAGTTTKSIPLPAPMKVSSSAVPSPSPSSYDKNTIRVRVKRRQQPTTQPKLSRVSRGGMVACDDDDVDDTPQSSFNDDAGGMNNVHGGIHNPAVALVNDDDNRHYDFDPSSNYLNIQNPNASLLQTYLHGDDTTCSQNTSVRSDNNYTANKNDSSSSTDTAKTPTKPLIGGDTVWHEHGNGTVDDNILRDDNYNHREKRMHVVTSRSSRNADTANNNNTTNNNSSSSSQLLDKIVLPRNYRDIDCDRIVMTQNLLTFGPLWWDQVSHGCKLPPDSFVLFLANVLSIQVKEYLKSYPDRVYWIKYNDFWLRFLNPNSYCWKNNPLNVGSFFQRYLESFHLRFRKYWSDPQFVEYPHGTQYHRFLFRACILFGSENATVPTAATTMIDTTHQKKDWTNTTNSTSNNQDATTN